MFVYKSIIEYKGGKKENCYSFWMCSFFSMSVHRNKPKKEERIYSLHERIFLLFILLIAYNLFLLVYGKPILVLDMPLIKMNNNNNNNNRREYDLMHRRCAKWKDRKRKIVKINREIETSCNLERNVQRARKKNETNNGDNEIEWNKHLCVREKKEEEKQLE